MLDPLRLALGTLTILPTGVVEVTPRVAGRAMALAPVAVLPLAVLAGALAWVGPRVGLPSLLCGVAVVALLAWGTRALHLDGLADTADGLGSGWDRERALAVMKQGDVGPFGVAALVLVLLAQAVAVGSLVAHPVLVGLLVCLSRCAVPTACGRGWPAARPGGLGAAVAGTVAGPVVAASWLVGVAVLALLPVAGASSFWLGLVPVGAAVAVGVLVAGCVRRFGGITGDVIGAAVEVAFTVALVAAVVVL